MQYEWNGVVFKIADEWLSETSAVGFMPPTSSYPTKPELSSKIIEIGNIRPPTRSRGKPWFKKDRMIRIVRGLVDGNALPPIEVHVPPNLIGYSFVVKDGFHRFYGSIALGFSEIPIEEIEYFDIRAQ